MELANSNSTKKYRQAEIFEQYARVLTAEQKALNNSNSFLSGYIFNSLTCSPAESNGELVLTYNDFIRLISNSKSLYYKVTDHSFNLNQIPDNVFGCIFFAVDEKNKGYLTISDWFHFNNLLEYDNFHLIILYEFFKKFDDKIGKNKFVDKSVNYGNKFLSFDQLYLNLDRFKSTIKLLHSSIDDTFLKSNSLLLDWDSFEWLKFYKMSPYFDMTSSYLSLNSLVTILQNDLKQEKIFLGFDRLSNMNPLNNSLTISKNQLIYLLKLFYSHRISNDAFKSLDLSNTKLIKSNNNNINYNVFKDIFFLFQNFDLLNQIFIKMAQFNGFNDHDIRNKVITKRDFLEFLKIEYNKVNNIIEFSPSQINLLFSIVSNSKENNRVSASECSVLHHQDTKIENFIHRECINDQEKYEDLHQFNNYYRDMIINNDVKATSSNLLGLFFSSKKDEFTASSNLTIQDFMKILNPNYLNDIVHQLELDQIRSKSLYLNFYFYPIFDSIYNFTLGSVAGCIGATMVYPIDLVKTRMQAQRNTVQYKNSINCFLKIFRREGFRGIYSGLAPQIIGVAPEKAIKLTVNDYMRNLLMDNKGQLKWYLEILSGCCAGACQVAFTNPLEIVKIRLQVRSEYTNDIYKSQVTVLGIIKQLGVSGLYRGTIACLLRDVPFSAIYFPTYAHLKKDLFNFDPKDKNKRRKLKTWELLLSGGLAGIPAAYLTTPFDVIKTRLQIDPKKGETSYHGIFHAAKTILKEESFRSFFKGGAARVLRSSPQFGFTLAAYEIFQNLFPLRLSSDHGFDASSDDSTINNLFIKRFQDSEHVNCDSKVVASQKKCNESLDPHNNNSLNYYYKSCQVAKLFIDLDYNFSKFDYTTYKDFQRELKNIGGK